MKNWLAAVLLALVLAVGTGAGYVAGNSKERTMTVMITTTTTTTTSISTAVTSRTNTTSSTCTDSGPTDGVVLRVVANNGSWEGVKISGEAVGYCNGQEEVTMLGPATTNSTGWVSFLEYGLPGIYYLSVNETAVVYSVSIVTVPTTTTVATLNLPTGSITTEFCEFNICH